MMLINLIYTIITKYCKLWSPFLTVCKALMCEKYNVMNIIILRRSHTVLSVLLLILL